MGAFRAWSMRLADIGPWNFYSPTYFSDYAPGYLYVLWFIGELNERFNFSEAEFEYVLKLPAIAADLASAYILYLFLDGKRAGVRLGAAVLYLVLPPVLLLGAVWGQVDSFSSLFIMLSIYWIGNGKPVHGTAVYVAGFVFKPQIIAALPFLAFWIMKEHPPQLRGPAGGLSVSGIPRVWRQATVAGLGTLILLIWPFFPEAPWNFIGHLRDAANVENYRVTSFWAYNFWGMFGFFRPDSETYLGITYQVWGVTLYAVSTLVVLVTFRDARDKGALALGVALSLLVFYLFMTRMHERYLFPALLPLLAACVIYRSYLLWGVFSVLAVVHFLNLYHVYVYYQALDGNTQLHWDWLYSIFEQSSFLRSGLESSRALSVPMFLSFPLLLLAAYLLDRRLWRRAPA
jgi:Gpi18-like mannosyltransferase